MYYLLYRANSHIKMSRDKSTYYINQQFFAKCIESNIEDIIAFYEVNKPQININSQDDELIKTLCVGGNLVILQLLYSIDKEIQFKLDVIVQTCINGKCDVLKWIYSIQKEEFANLEYNNHYAFRTACKNNFIDVAIFLQSINSKYKMITENKVVIEHWVENDINLCVFYDTPWGLELKTLLNTQDIRIQNIDKLLEKINNLNTDEMKFSTHSKTSKRAERLLDKNVRNSTVSDEIIIFLDGTDVIKQLAWPNTDVLIDIYNEFNCIKYPVGGKFEWHKDTQLFSKHNYTILIYPPQSIVGGELVVKTSTSNKKIKVSEHLWKIIMLPIGATHCSKEVITGTKTTLKGKAFVREHTKVYVYNDSDSESDVD